MTPPARPDHDGTVERLTYALVGPVYPRASVRVQSSFAALDVSQPSPGLVVAPRADHTRCHPSGAWLVVESLRKDLGRKARLFADCGVPECWVVDRIEDASSAPRASWTAVIAGTPRWRVKIA